MPAVPMPVGPNPIIVQKYGGSSVGDVARIRQVAHRVGEKRSAGYQLVVVVSAMGDTTDELLSLAKQVSKDPPRRELDMLLSCGERVSMALLSMALQDLGIPAISFTGSQSGIITNEAHSQARIVEVRPWRIQDALAEGRVVIVAGYQGVSLKREVTTLGRGGSDTTAVALAAALGAEACEIYSDVDGVFSADPRVVPEAQKLASLSYDEMQELAHAGARVLNAQAVQFAKEKGIVILARSAHAVGTGSRIEGADEAGPARVKAIAGDSELAVLSVNAATPLGPLLEFLEARGVRARFSSLQRGQGLIAAPLQDIHGAEVLIADLQTQFGPGVTLRTDLGSVTAVGAGVGTELRFTREILSAVEALGATAHATHSSPLQVAVLVERSWIPQVTRRLHEQLVAAALNLTP